VSTLTADELIHIEGLGDDDIYQLYDMLAQESNLPEPQMLTAKARREAVEEEARRVLADAEAEKPNLEVLQRP